LALGFRLKATDCRLQDDNGQLTIIFCLLPYAFCLLTFIVNNCFIFLPASNQLLSMVFFTFAAPDNPEKLNS